MFETYVWIYVQTTIIVLQFLIANELSQLHFQEFMINQMKNKIPSVRVKSDPNKNKNKNKWIGITE
jgi:hypothetical protein